MAAYGSRSLTIALNIHLECVGENHSETATTLMAIAGVHQLQGNYSEALTFYFRALGIYLQIVGYKHSYTGARKR